MLPAQTLNEEPNPELNPELNPESEPELNTNREQRTSNLEPLASLRPYPFFRSNSFMNSTSADTPSSGNAL